MGDVDRNVYICMSYFDRHVSSLDEIKGVATECFSSLACSGCTGEPHVVEVKSLGITGAAAASVRRTFGIWLHDDFTATSPNLSAFLRAFKTARDIHNGQYVKFSRISICRALTKARIQELVAAQPVQEGAQERVRKSPPYSPSEHEAHHHDDKRWRKSAVNNKEQVTDGLCV